MTRTTLGILLIALGIGGLVYRYQNDKTTQTDTLPDTTVAPMRTFPATPTSTGAVLEGTESTTAQHGTSSTPTLPVITTESLAQYNGSDPSLPIYIAFEGLVYDVSEGSKFYAPGGAYNFLAGTDGTTLLRIAGGETIKKKYPVVGTLSP